MNMMLEQFKNDVDDGLSAKDKSLSSKYFYDATGDALFQKIMHMPEYYLTRAELEIFQRQSRALSEVLASDLSEIDIIELGAGDGSKVIYLLEALWQNVSFNYRPVDISANALQLLQNNIQAQAPHIPVHPVVDEYFSALDHIGQNRKPKALLFLGSNIGNLTDSQAAEFMQNIDRCLQSGDKILLGVDINKDAESVLKAYDDEQGITRDFNLNLLERINNELGADFDLKQFEHDPIYVEESSSAVSYLKSLNTQSVHISSLDKTYHFKENERIHTEISRKYDRQDLTRMIKNTGLEISHVFTDSQSLFADFVLTKQ